MHWQRAVESRRPPVREIVLATDFSDNAQEAAEVARQCARAFGARVHLLHVITFSGEFDVARLLGDLVRTFGLTPTLVRSLASHDPGADVVEYARKHAADLIVMGTRGRGGFGRGLMGSVADRVVRDAPCPVLTVPARPAASARGSY